MDKNILITGSTRGIGKAIYDELLKTGSNIDSPRRQELDLECLDSIKKYNNKFKSYDIIVNCAGINITSPFIDFNHAVWNRMSLVNLTAPMLLIQNSLPHMRAKNFGRIINITSIFAKVTKPQRALYTATKAALSALTKTIASEEAQYGITANCVSPGFINTELTKQNNSAEDIAKITRAIPAQRLGEPEEIANFVRFLTTTEANYCNGQDFTVDGGFIIQ